MPGVGGSPRKFQPRVTPLRPFCDRDFEPLVPAATQLPFLAVISSYTTNLGRFHVEFVKPNVSFRQFAEASPGFDAI